MYSYRYHVSWDKISLRYLIVLCLISACLTLIYCSKSQNHNCLILSHDFRFSASTRELSVVHWPWSEIVRQKTIENRETKWDGPRDRSSPMRKGSSFIRVYTMGDCQHASPVFTQHAWVYTLTRCCVDFEIFNTCFVSGFTQYKQVQQHFRVYTVILRLSLRPREQYVIPTDGATNAPVPLQGSSSSNNPRKSKESTPSKRR